MIVDERQKKAISEIVGDLGMVEYGNLLNNKRLKIVQIQLRALWEEMRVTKQ